MRLTIAALVLVVYIVASLIWRLPCRLWAKIALGCVVLVVGSKFMLYEIIGGSFIAPDFPFALLLTMECLYCAMVILAFLLLVKDCLGLLLWIGRRLGGSWRLPLTPALRGGGLCGLALALAILGMWQSMRPPSVHTVDIPVPGLPPELDGLAIVQLSDLHIGPLLKKAAWVQQVVNTTNALDADLVVLTGDMVDGAPQALRRDIAPLRNLHARYGVYGITGNHEYYSGVRQWLPAFSDLGIVMLLNEYRTVAVQGKNLILAGVPDQVAPRFGEAGPDYGLLPTLPDGIRVLLQHRPSGAPGKSGIDLQLSGHTHGGQLFFLQWLVALFNGGLVEGLYNLDGTTLYVSTGTGIWAGFSCRIGVSSEIARIILRRPQARI